MIDAELDKDDEIFIDDVVVSLRPCPHTGATATLIRILATSIQFAIPMLHGINVSVGEFDTLVVETLLVRNTLLERRSVDLVRDRLSIDGVADIGVLDLESAVQVGV